MNYDGCLAAIVTFVLVVMMIGDFLEQRKKQYRYISTPAVQPPLGGFFVLKTIRGGYMEVKVRILDTCPHCNGQAFLPVGEDVDYKGEKYIRHHPCPHCEGSGRAGRWVELSEITMLLDQAKCPHKHVSRTGGFHFSAGEVWDDVREVCDDCGEILP